MSEQLVPANDYQMQPWQGAEADAPATPRSPIERPLAAIRRYKWLMIAIVIAATAGGIVATRFLKPSYEVQARVMITTQGAMDDRSGPIRSAGLLSADDWVQLLRSYSIVDAVVRKLSLYVAPDKIADKGLFKGFVIAQRYSPGKYELLINQTAKTWRVNAVSVGGLSDAGGMADSVGRVFGFQWVLPRSAFYSGTGTRKVAFTVATPRETAVKLVSRLRAGRGEGSNFMNISFEDPDPLLAASTINTWLNEYVSVAAMLKRRRLVDFTGTLEGQLKTSKASLDSAEAELSGYRVNTIVEPNETAPIAAGLAATTDPVTKRFFDERIRYEEVQRDITALTNVLNSSRDSVSTDALLGIQSVAAGGASAQPLLKAISDYTAAQSSLTANRQFMTDENPTIKEQSTAVANMRARIPVMARDFLTGLRTRAADDSSRIASSRVNLQKIPQRTIDEERYRRRRDVAAGINANLQNRAAEAQLAEASATPDVTVLDSAIAPLEPTNNSAPRLVAIAILGGVAAAVGLAILLDKMDGRFRYPEQSTDDLGLRIAGTVPQFPRGGIDQRSTEQMFQLVESFRTLRMSVLQASTGGVSLAVSSPAPGEGKSLISANLAMSFADAGLRTILVDGDTRRGTLHQMFGLECAPGLTDYLAGDARTSDVVMATTNSRLFVMASGTRQGRSPELLTSPRLRELVAELRANFDVVIFDTPPLAAGIDGYSIATATGSLLVVLRVGQTRRRMASEKLRVLDRLPVDIVGSVLNGVDFRDGYEFYGYVPGYEAVDEPGTAVARV